MKELKFLFQILHELYQKPVFDNISIEEIDLNKLLILAKKNNLLFYVCQLLKENYFPKISASGRDKIDSIIKEGNEELEKISKSINVSNENIEEYVLIKTYRGYPRIANDLDILVEDFYREFDNLKNDGINYRDWDKQLLEVVFQNEGMAKIHLHGKIGWLNRSYFDLDIVWQNPRKALFSDRQVSIPGFTADFLIHLAHMNFEPMHFTLSELLYLFKISEKVNWELVYRQSKKYNWHRTLLKTLEILDAFHWYFFDSPANFPGISETKNKKVHNDDCLVFRI